MLSESADRSVANADLRSQHPFKPPGSGDILVAVPLNPSWPQRLYRRVLEELQLVGLDLPIAQLQSALPRNTPIFLVGGFVRDCVRALIESISVDAKDADIVASTDRLDSAMDMLDGILSRTSLGGYRWRAPEKSVWIDAWELKETIWIHSLELPVHIDSFLDGVDLNVDRIAVGLHDRSIYDRGCSSAIIGRTIDLDAKVRLRELEPDELARAVVAHLKTGYQLSGSVRRALARFELNSLAARATQRLLGDGYPDLTVAQVSRFIRSFDKQPTTVRLSAARDASRERS
jgi:hypothetical protein